MKKLIIGIALVAVAAGLPVGVLALTTASGTNVTQPTEVKDLYMAGGNTLDLTGSFGDDVYLAGNTVTLPGTTAGDLTVGGGTVTVNGDVKGGVRIAGGTVTLNGKVGKNVVLLGGTLTIGASADITGEVFIAGGTVTINGHVAKAVTAWVGTMTIDGTIDGPVSIHLDNGKNTENQPLHIQKNAVLKGSLTYWSSQDVVVDAGSKVDGTVTRNEPTNNEAAVQGTIQRLVNFGRIWNLLSLLVVGVLFALLFPKTLKSVVATMVSRSGASIGWGILIALAAPFGLIILVMTVIGIPLGLIMLGLYITGLYLAQVIIGFLVGSLIMKWLTRRRNADNAAPAPRTLAPVWQLVLGVLVVSLILDFLFGWIGDRVGIISFLLGIIRLFLSVWAFGALLIVTFGAIRERELS